MRKNVVRIAALVLLLALLLPALALADSFAVVKGGRLNLRQYASTESYSLGKYDTGTWVRIIGTDGGWSYVQTPDGKSGYMSSAYLDFGSAGTGATVKYANGGYVNLRSGPSTDYGVIMRVTSGSTVHIQNSTGEWYYICAYNGSMPVYGYMYRTYLTMGSGTAVVTTRNGGDVNMRSGPGSSHASIGKLASGTAVTVLLKGGDWYMISANGMTGYMSTQYLSGTGDTIGTNTGSGTTSSSIAYVNNPKNTQVLNLREYASTSARSIGQYRNGTKVKVVSKSSTWCEVYVGTRHGYMMTKYLSFNDHYIMPAPTAVPYYPIVTAAPYYPVVTAAPYVPIVTAAPYVPMVTAAPTAAPTATVQYVTPKPQQPGAPAAPKAGDSVTLTFASGGGSTINVYYDATMTTLKASYTANKQAMMLQYGQSVCMVYVDGGVAYVPTWNVNY